MKEDVWVISDTHFSHKNIIKYENRPFNNVEEMNEAMISNWNKTVKPKDTVWHLGDVFFCNSEQSKEIGNRLNGNKILILGNHDKKTKTHYNECGFGEVFEKDVYIVSFSKPIVFSHHPVDSELLKSLGVKNVHGHVHSKTQGLDKDYYKCVSVEMINYTPIHIEQLRKWAEHE